jgi:hypothetical protein
MTRLLVTSLLFTVSGCKDRRENPFDALCAGTARIVESDATQPEAGKQFVALIAELDPDDPAAAAVQAARFADYVRFVKVLRSIAIQPPLEKARLLEEGARDAGLANWSCPAFTETMRRLDAASAREEAPQPPKTETQEPSAPARLPPGTRTLKPLSPSGDSCLEMYSHCEKDPKGGNRCHSVPFHLECGETARLPSSGQMLHCVCP